MNNNLIWLAVPIGASVVAVAFAAFLARWVLSQNTGTKAMQEVAGYIFEGAQAFLRRQYQTIGILAIVAAIVIGGLLAIVTQLGTHSGDVFGLAIRTAIAFLIGAACSGLAGYIGMLVAVRANVRVASAAMRSLGDALVVAMRGGAVTGFLVIALSLLGVTLVYIAFGGLQNPSQTPTLIVGFGFGASFVALFAQLGGGIYTKAADVGADLVGKVVSGLPEDDPRNPAVIADLVGDNVGDCAGRGADLFESTAAENIGAMILGAAVATTLVGTAGTANPGWIILPLVAVGFGIFASLIGVLFVRSGAVNAAAERSGSQGSVVAMNQMNNGFYVTAFLSAIGIVAACYFLLRESTPNWWYFAIAGLVGIANTFAFVFITQYYTSGSWRPVKEIAHAALTGPATTVISGLAVGFENTGLPVLAIGASLGAAYALGNAAGLNVANHGIVSTGGIYATAIATVGMLMSVGYILAMDSFGPITDNAGGIVEMSAAPESVRDVTDALDSVGNTTKALTKGYGIGSAALAAFLLIGAYLDVLAASKVSTGLNFVVNLANPPMFIAALLGAALIFVFSSLAMRAVSTAAQGMIKEVLRQFAANPLIKEGKAKPDYNKCVDISTQAALRQMILPGILVVAVPILVGVTLGPEAAAALLIAGTIAGIMMALVMNNGGGAWDNAKKYIEAGNLTDEKGVVQKKGSLAHAAAVVGDTIGDPFKDTAGPSLHVVIKLLSTITLVLAPLYIFLHK